MLLRNVGYCLLFDTCYTFLKNSTPHQYRCENLKSRSNFVIYINHQILSAWRNQDKIDGTYGRNENFHRICGKPSVKQPCGLLVTVKINFKNVVGKWIILKRVQDGSNSGVSEHGNESMDPIWARIKFWKILYFLFEITSCDNLSYSLFYYYYY